MLTLGIESSCDETAGAICNDGEIISNVVLSQIIHKQFEINGLRYIFSGGLNFKQILPSFFLPFLDFVSVQVQPYTLEPMNHDNGIYLKLIILDPVGHRMRTKHTTQYSENN